MIVSSELTFTAPAQNAWATLLNGDRVVRFPPGATVEPFGEAQSYRGPLNVKLRPGTIAYEGTTRLLDVDEDTWTLICEAAARERSARGTAAVITARLAPDEGGRESQPACRRVRRRARRHAPACARSCPGNSYVSYGPRGRPEPRTAPGLPLGATSDADRHQPGAGSRLHPPTGGTAPHRRGDTAGRPRALAGEGGTLAPAGAVANAVSDALSSEFNELPLLPAQVRAAAVLLRGRAGAAR